MHNTIKYITPLGNYDVHTGYYGARYYEPVLALWYGVDALAERHPNVSSYVYTLCNPIRYIDPDGNTEDERNQAINKAIEYKDKNPGNTYTMGGMGEPGQGVDCSGMVRKCIIASGLSDPTLDSKGDGEWQNGVALLVNGKGVRKVNEDQIRNGDLITLDIGRGKGVDGEYDHIGIIINIASDGTISFVHSGSDGPKIGTYNKNGNGYWDTRARGFYQWDTEEFQNYQTVNSVRSEFRQGPTPKLSDKLKESRIPIVKTIGEIVSVVEKLFQ